MSIAEEFTQNATVLVKERRKKPKTGHELFDPSNE
jgi:hypothetical protein